MRLIKNPQLRLGATDISEIKFDPKSRDDIPQLLRGLQHIYTTPDVKDKVFKILDGVVPDGVSQTKGRPGMELWNVFVMGTLRLNLNCDYDRLLELVNQHNTIRAMLGHGVNWEDDYQYHLQTLKDNVSLLTPELLDKINTVVVQSGRKLVKKNEEESLKGRCDSFVVETHVHYPTDISLLWDAMRKIIGLIAMLCCSNGLGVWRQNKYNLRKLKKLFRIAQKSNQSKAKNAEENKKEAHENYLYLAEWFMQKALLTIEALKELNASPEKLKEIEIYINHAQRQLLQIQKRVIDGEAIPNNEKVYSIFQPHTEWVSKGKAGVPVELGIKVCVMECQYGFLLHHRVMEKEQDVDIAVSMVTATKDRFPEFNQCSYDKGFHSPDNQLQLADKLDRVVLPKKGRLSKNEQERESDDEFKRAKRQHSAVESAINALEVHGLDRCPDHGIDGFKRYVSLAVVARNIQKLGAVLHQKEKDAERRRQARCQFKEAA